MLALRLKTSVGGTTGTVDGVGSPYRSHIRSETRSVASGAVDRPKTGPSPDSP